MADSKATTYLLAIAALAPILTYFEGAIWGGKLSLVPPWLALPILALAIVYGIGAVAWVLQTIKLVSYSRLGAIELVNLSRKRKCHAEGLIRCYLENARRNSDTNNDRLTKLRMAHAFLVRTFLVFLIFIFLEAIFGICKSLPADTFRFNRYLHLFHQQTNAAIDGKFAPHGNKRLPEGFSLRPSNNIKQTIRPETGGAIKAKKEADPVASEKESPPRSSSARCGYYHSTGKSTPATSVAHGITEIHSQEPKGSSGR